MTTAAVSDDIELNTGGPVCGNGTVEGSEQCDDNNTNNADGCNSTCQRETQTGYCTAKPGHSSWYTVSEILQTCNTSNGSACQSRVPDS